jgi:hypothetical protein
LASLFSAAFSSYAIDHQTAGIALAEWIARLRGTSATNLGYQLVFAMGATLCVAAALIRTWVTAYLNSEVMVGMRLDTSPWLLMALTALSATLCISGTSCWR